MWAKPLRDLETVGMFCISEEKVLGSPEALGTRRKPYKDSTKPATKPAVQQEGIPSVPKKVDVSVPSASTPQKSSSEVLRSHVYTSPGHCHEHRSHDPVKSHGVPRALHFQQDKSNYSSTWEADTVGVVYPAPGLLSDCPLFPQPHLLLINSHVVRNYSMNLENMDTQKEKYDTGYFS